MSRSRIERLNIPSADTVLHQHVKAAVDHLGEAAQLLPDGLRLSTNALVFVFRPLCVEEVATVDDGVWLQLTIDSAVSLLHAGGFHGTSKWKMFQQWA